MSVGFDGGSVCSGGNMMMVGVDSRSLALGRRWVGCLRTFLLEPFFFFFFFLPIYVFFWLLLLER